MSSASACVDVPIYALAVDPVTGDFASLDTAASTSVGMEMTTATDSASTVFSPSSNPWQTGKASSTETRICGINPQDGMTTEIDVALEGNFKDGEISKQSTGQHTITVTRTSIYTSINCLKGKTVRVVSAAKPVCPAGYAKTNLKVVNGKLAPTTITCVKGFLTKRVTGVLPSCPAGYRRK